MEHYWRCRILNLYEHGLAVYLSNLGKEADNDPAATTNAEAILKAVASMIEQHDKGLDRRVTTILVDELRRSARR